METRKNHSKTSTQSSVLVIKMKEVKGFIAQLKVRNINLCMICVCSDPVFIKCIAKNMCD